MTDHPDDSQPTAPVAASRDAFGWDDEPISEPVLAPPKWSRSTPDADDLRLGAFLFVVSWFALVGLIATLRWLTDGAAMLLRGAGL